MSQNIISRWMALPLLVVLAVIACGTPVSVTSPPEPTANEEIFTEPENTATVEVQQPTSTDEVVQEATTAGTAPSCTVLIQGLNLRSGPGTAYRPAIRQLDSNSKVTPLGFAPQGLVGGSWAYVQDLASQDKGWVSTGPKFISCNIDLATLPPVAFGTPQPTFPSTAQVSPGPGTCGQGGITSDSTGDVYDCDVKFSDDFLIQMVVLKNGQKIGEADGVQNVVFSVSQKNGNTVYNHTENNQPYCIFGGDSSSCSSWVTENYVTKWEPGGVVLESGDYTISITPTLNDPSINLFWSADIKLNLP
jgi:hypothetical protein